MKGVSTAFWSVVLLGSTFSIAAGFAGGRSVVSAGALSPPPIPVELPPPEPIRIQAPYRQLIGLHSLDGDDDVDAYADPTLGVAAHDWPQQPFDALRQRAKLAIVVVDASRAGSDLDAFAASPLAFTFVVSPQDGEAERVRDAALAAGKSVLVDATDASPADVAALDGGTSGIWGSLDGRDARALVRSLPRGTLVVDAALSDDDELAPVARRARCTVLTRDVLADARPGASYVAFMLNDALAIAQRHGFAIVVVHGRTDTLTVVRRFADRARRDGADIVPIASLLSPES